MRGPFLFGIVILASAASASRNDTNAEATQEQLQEQTQSIESTALGGTSEGGAGGAGGAGGSSLIEGDDVNVRVRTRRNAPSVTINAPGPTADFMVCFGLGGSSQDGAATGIRCYIQRDLYASHRAAELKALGLPKQATEAYCDRKLHWQDFGSKAKCAEEYFAALTEPEDPPDDPKAETPPGNEFSTAGGEQLAAIDPEVARRLEALEAENKRQRAVIKKLEKRQAQERQQLDTSKSRALKILEERAAAKRG